MTSTPLRTSHAENGHPPTRDGQSTEPLISLATPQTDHAATLELPLLLTVLTLGSFWAIQTTNYDDTQWWTAGLLAAAVLVGVAVVRGLPFAPWMVLAHAVAVGFADRIVRTPFTGTDVRAATEEAIDVLLNGGNPYGHYFSSAEGMIPYPPGELFFYTIPHLLFGRIDRTDQWAGIGIVLLLAALAPLVGPARAALATALYATFGLAAHLAMDGSNDTSLAFLIVLSVVLLSWSERGGRAARVLFYASAFTFGWALLFKQFTVLIYPFVVLYLRRRGAPWKQHAAISVGLAALVALPFFLTEPSGFKRNMFDIAYVHQDVWGLNGWAALEGIAPGLVDRLHSAIPVVNFLGVAIVFVALALRPASNLGTALLQGLGLLFVALFLGRWTTSPYYTGPAAIFATATALVSLPALSPRVATLRQPETAWRWGDRRWWPSMAALARAVRSRGLTPAVPAAAALTCALFITLVAWTSGWVTSARTAGGPFEIMKPDVTFVDSRMSVATSFTMQREETVRAWFFLARPGEPEPWANYIYQSSVVQQTITAGEPALFHWSEVVNVPDGEYDLSIWIHKRVGDGWVHLYGGGPASVPLAVNDNSARPVGPFILTLGLTVPPLRSGRPTSLELGVSGTAAGAECEARWELRRSLRGQPLASGEGGDCAKPEIDLPSSLSPGAYTLEIIAMAVGDQESEESDRLTVPVEVKGATEVFGPVELAVAGAPPALTVGQTTTVELQVTGTPAGATCQAQWRLSVAGGGRPVASGEGGDCAHPAIALPATLRPGDYNLEITAVVVSGDHSEASDRLMIPVVVN